MPSLARTKPSPLGLSDHSLGLSCARPVLTRSQAALALERPGEIREVVEADGIGDFLGQCAWMGEPFAGPLQPVAQQMLAKACALLLAEGAAKLGWAESAQGGHILQRDLALEMRRHMRDGRMGFPVPARAIRDGRGFAALLVDAEHAFDPTYAENLGVKVDSLFLSQPDYGEQALEIADRLIASGSMDVVVIDSVAALVPKSELEGEMGDSKMGLHARLMSQAMRKMTGSISKTNTIVIFINQLRDIIGAMGYGPSETTTGGKALKFYASVRLDVRRIQQIKDGDVATGNKTKVKVVKNKVAPPFKTAEFDIIFGQGINHIGEVIDAAVTKNIIQKSGSWYSYSNSKLGQGRDSVQSLLKDNEEMFNEIKSKLND